MKLWTKELKNMPELIGGTLDEYGGTFVASSNE